MRDELQQLVDRIADRVGRPALVEDRRQRVVCYSAQAEPLDEVRRSSILRRSTTPEVIAFFAGFDITRSHAPVRTPAAPALGLLPRVCVPVWHSDLLLGFVWFVDSPPLPAAGLAQAVSSSGELAMALYRVNLLGELAARREADAVRGLLSADASVRFESVTLVVGEDLLDSDGPTVALVATDPDPARLEQALVATRRWYGSRSAVHLARTSRGVVLLRPPAAAPAAPSSAAPGIMGGVTGAGSAEILAAAEYLAGQVSGVVGVGDAVPSLADAATSVEQATQAARIAVQLPAAVGSTRVAVWSRLGVYRILAAADLTGIEVHPGLSRLSPSFVATLEAYLDLAGDAAATAARLRVHRTTLYYRLARIEELTGADLRDGLQRLALHLAVKAAHLVD
jgi:PucR C-terminal helix-turn-helix domain/GGDEF-like domain